MFGFKQLIKLLRLLNEGQSPNQLAAAVALGLWLGMIPGWPLQVFILLLFIAFFNVNIGLAVIGALIGAGLGWLIDPWLDGMGVWALEGLHGLEPLWTIFYNNPFFMLSRFNNTVVMGATLVGGVLAFIGFFILRHLITLYRQHILATIQRFKVVQFLQGSKFVRLLQRVNEGGAS